MTRKTVGLNYNCATTTTATRGIVVIRRRVKSGLSCGGYRTGTGNGVSNDIHNATAITPIVGGIIVTIACAATSTIFLVQNLGGYPIILAGNAEQKKRFLPRLAAGEITAAFSLLAVLLLRDRRIDG